jgi:hypothetical protein
MSELEEFQTNLELALYKEYNEQLKNYKYTVESERRFYLCNEVDVKVSNPTSDVYYDITLTDCWIYDVYRKEKKAKSVKILSFRDVNIEENF